MFDAIMAILGGLYIGPKLIKEKSIDVLQGRIHKICSDERQRRSVVNVDKYCDLDFENKLIEMGRQNRRREMLSMVEDVFDELNIKSLIGIDSYSKLTVNWNFFKYLARIIILAKNGKLPHFETMSCGTIDSFDSFSNDEIKVFHACMCWVSDQMMKYGLGELQCVQYKFRYHSGEYSEDGYAPVHSFKEPRRSSYFWLETINPLMLTYVHKK